MKKILNIIFLSCFTISSYANQLTTVPKVDLKKYSGKWYEIASLPNWFQRGCRCTSATYGIQEGYISVLNQCRRGDNNKLSSAHGKAWAVPNSNNSKLKVQFFWPFKGDYWILYLTPGYQQVIVGTPNYKYLWILSRSKKIDKKLYSKLVNIAKTKGFDVRRLVKTSQECDS